MPLELGPFSLDRMVAAVERVRDRLLRSTRALAAAGVPYAVAGGNAVAAWVSRVDTAAVRNTQDVDILIRREDLDRARTALESAGFVYRHVAGVDVFLDGPDAKPRDGVHVVFAGEKVRAHEPAANPDVSESEDDALFRVLTLDALVRIKLSAFRRKDQVHLQDMLEVGLIDSTWLTKLPPELALRLQSILDDPNG
ncbi:MAG: nucleotidyltransferase family protein [Phycisphaerae bacterium]|nr:nucleotidyltransferase family protein [Tepidisphaeraceae bacterium]